MTAVIDRTGQRFGRLVVERRNGSDRQGRAMWLCLCDCGGTITVASRHLGSGATFSCGCYGRSVWPENGKRGAHLISGARSHLYNTELTPEERLNRRNVPEVREWRKAVFFRDDYTCDLCGERGKQLVAHHLNCWAKYPDARFDLSNGITLCASDHKAFHDSLGGPRIPCRAIDYDKYKESNR